MGCLFASALPRAGLITTVLTKEQHTGLSIHPTTTLAIEDQSSCHESTLPTSNNGYHGYISHLLVTTKAYDVRSALAQVAHRLDPDSHILLLINGLGFLEELQADHPSLQFVCAITTEGAYRIDRRHIFHAGRGLTRLGQPGLQQSPPWFEEWSHIALASTWESDIETALWQKLAINCAINPLTALHRCPNGDLINQPGLAEELSQLVTEISRISVANGFSDIAATLAEKVRDVISGTSSNQSSMLQDILAGRRTEIDYLSGHLLARAKLLNIEAPLTTNLVAKIKKLDGSITCNS